MTVPDHIPTGRLEELAGLIHFRVGAWHDFGYETPPAPDCKPVPPLGERSADAIRAGHAAVDAIDELVRQLHALRSQLTGELRQNSDLLGARVDAMLAARRPDQRAAALAQLHEVRSLLVGQLRRDEDIRMARPLPGAAPGPGAGGQQ